MAAYLCIQHVNVWRGRRDWLKKKGKKKKVKGDNRKEREKPKLSGQ